jgi:hypothetical protein
VDIVWLFLYIFVYIWGSGEPPLIKNSPQLLKVSRNSTEFIIEGAKKSLEELKYEFKTDPSKYMANTNLNYLIILSSDS